MPILVQLLLAFAVGSTLAVAVMVWRGRRAHQRWVRTVMERVGPVVDRRAAVLGISLRVGPEVGVGHDGELEMDDTDDFHRLLRLVDAIDAREHAQLGYLDTMRVSKEDVEAGLVERTGERVKG